MLSDQEITEAFINANLVENYNFLQEDLVKLAHAFINAAKPQIQQEERTQCVNVARALNREVAEKILEVRNG